MLLGISVEDVDGVCRADEMRGSRVAEMFTIALFGTGAKQGYLLAGHVLIVIPRLYPS